MMLKLALSQLLIAGALLAQNAPQFDVASIKPAAPIIAGQGAQNAAVGVHIDRNQFRANSMSLRDYLAMGYNVRIYQIEGPDWIANERFDIHAVVPEGTIVDEKTLPPMMKALVEDRFQIKTHRISREFPVYALVQAKDGIKAKESPLEAETDSVTIGGTGGPQGTVIQMGRGSSLAVGSNRITARKFSMLVLAETLARFMDRPVLDQTGLTATYDVDLELTQEDFQALMIRAAIAAGVSLPPQALKLIENNAGDSLHNSLGQYGLKLEGKKLPMDVVVIDSLTRTPSEN